MIPTAADAGQSRLVRRLVLCTAFAAGLAVALLPRTASVHAQGNPPAPPKPPSVSKTVTVSDDKGHTAKIEVTTEDSSAESADKAAVEKGAAADAAPGADSGAKPSKARKRARITIDGDDTVDQVLDHSGPKYAAMVLGIVAVVFLAPVLLIALVLWYRFRKARMLNETMLKLAEKGIVPPAEALGALADGKPAAAMQTGPAALMVEQAKQVRRRAAWSDLRKGVLAAGVGIALILYSLVADGEPNGLGFVLLFVGIGFLVLWWFEERRMAPPGAAPGSGAPGSAGGSPPTA